ncbi:PAS domain-containing sensor histidine kinase [Sphingosinicella terrae]|uniref:PAS domain-containing sensor histidine kinase n=1 Tax=Sphingosinicella terrae TaxID=2172047 RepID=UPI000E0DDF1C|nr:PAS domain-containing protein [Sphingosinicella terrae]
MASPPPDADKADLAGERPDVAPSEIDRLRAELETLRAREAMYRHAAELAESLVWCADPSGHLLEVGTGFSTLIGMEDALALEGGWVERVHPSDRQRLVDQWNRSLATGQPFEVEFRGLFADGSTRALRSRAMAVRDAQGRIDCWYGSTEDIDKQREAERRLRESEQLHRITLDLTRQIVWSIGPDGTGRTLSPRFLEITGLSPEDDPSRALHPDERESFMEGMAEAIARGSPYSAEVRLRVSDGSYHYFRVRAVPHYEQGRITRWYGVGEDIHDEWLADQSRREIDRRYRLAIEATGEAVWDYDIPGDRLEWSENSAVILGADTGSAGMSRLDWWAYRLHPEERDRVLASFWGAIDGDGNLWSEEYRFRRDDGDYADMLDRGFIIRGPQGEPRRAVGAMADVTARKRAEAEVRRMQAELIHVSRVSAMGTMASTLAHELNQPLAALSNFISGARRLAAAGPAKQAELIEALEAAAAGANRAGEIIRRLRDLVSRGTVSVQTQNLPTLIDEAAVVAFVDARALGIRHRIHLDRDAAWVRADPIQIQQVLINLIRNAVEAIGGSERREIDICTHAAGTMVEVEVADSGGGIAPEQFDTLFSRFVTTKSGGMGIGLAISRTIVELHGGKIWAENRPAGGAVFRFTLPRAEPPRNST